MSAAYAIAVTEENLRGVIASEAGSDYDLDQALAWLSFHEEGWFVRDEESSLDCYFFRPEAFEEAYAFSEYDEGVLISRIVRL